MEISIVNCLKSWGELAPEKQRLVLIMAGLVVLCLIFYLGYATGIRIAELHYIPIIENLTNNQQITYSLV